MWPWTPGPGVVGIVLYAPRGVAALAYTWGEGLPATRLWRANCLGEVSQLFIRQVFISTSSLQVGSLRASPHSTGVAVVGSEAGQVVVTRQGPTLVVRWPHPLQRQHNSIW